MITRERLRQMTADLDSVGFFRNETTEELRALVSSVEFAKDVAEQDCNYGDGCHGTHSPRSTPARHGRCTACAARLALGLPASAEGVYP
jgi:hypothetical protein